jgi:hypothetical protein
MPKRAGRVRSVSENRFQAVADGFKTHAVASSNVNALNVASKGVEVRKGMKWLSTICYFVKKSLYFF